MLQLTDVGVIITVAFFTFLTRLFPFALFGRHQEVPRMVQYLGSVLPATVIAILVIYCVKLIRFTDVSTYLPAFIAIALVVVLHVWKRNILLSIGLGTIGYMVMVQLIFVA